MGALARLLIIDRVVPEQPSPEEWMGYLVDMAMLAENPGGRERTKEEFRKLLQSAGFELARVVAVGGISDVIEAQPRQAAT
jgi:O-methyltransferase domain